MKLLRDRNDQAALGGIGILLGAGLAVAIGNALVGSDGSVIAGSAHAESEAILAHNVAAEASTSIVRAPTDLPQMLGGREAATVRVELETIELVGDLADGATYRYWTFNGQVPGPFVRVRVGDSVKVTLKNHEESWMSHNVDFHAVTGPGGGAVATVADPGDSRSFTFKALNPGLYVYHCAIPTAAQHIDTEEAFGAQGELTESYEKLINETPEYYVFNGAANALMEGNALRASVGETVRIYFGSVTSSSRATSNQMFSRPMDRSPRSTRRLTREAGDEPRE
jgi:nitrite reductase (NO-forming)